jgi:formate/nitrite transporter FocA (FNT family)
MYKNMPHKSVISATKVTIDCDFRHGIIVVVIAVVELHTPTTYVLAPPIRNGAVVWCSIRS